MVDNIAQAFLFFTHGIFIIPFILFGYFWLDPIFFSRLSGIIFLSFIINIALKVSFQVPLLASVGHPGFAFPSGHMQLASVLYGWFILRIANLYLRLVLIGLLFGIGFALVHFNYHLPNEVAAGLVCGFFILFIYQHLIIKYPKKEGFFLLFFGLIGLIYSWLRYHYLNSLPIPSHLWSSYFSCLGLILGNTLFMPKSTDAYEFSYDLNHSFKLYSFHLLGKTQVLKPIFNNEEPRRCFLLFWEKKLLANFSFCILALLIYFAFEQSDLLRENLIFFQFQWLLYLLALPLSLHLAFRLH